MSSYNLPGQKRTSVACDACHRRKLKCSGELPCSRCVRAGVTCQARVPRRRGPRPTWAEKGEAKSSQQAIAVPEARYCYCGHAFTDPKLMLCPQCKQPAANAKSPLQLLSELNSMRNVLLQNNLMHLHETIFNPNFNSHFTSLEDLNLSPQAFTGPAARQVGPTPDLYQLSTQLSDAWIGLKVSKRITDPLFFSSMEIIGASESACSVLGYEQSELVGQNASVLWPPVALDQMNPEDSRHFVSTPGTISKDLHVAGVFYMSKFGQLIECEVVGRVHYSKEGNAELMVQNMVAARIASETPLHTVPESMPEPEYVLAKQCGFVNVIDGQFFPDLSYGPQVEAPIVTDPAIINLFNREATSTSPATSSHEFDSTTPPPNLYDVLQ